jgi:hypothetical protein
MKFWLCAAMALAAVAPGPVMAQGDVAGPSSGNAYFPPAASGPAPGTVTLIDRGDFSGRERTAGCRHAAIWAHVSSFQTLKAWARAWR